MVMFAVRSQTTKNAQLQGSILVAPIEQVGVIQVRVDHRVRQRIGRAVTHEGLILVGKTTSEGAARLILDEAELASHHLLQRMC